MNETNISIKIAVANALNLSASPSHKDAQTLHNAHTDVQTYVHMPAYLLASSVGCSSVTLPSSPTVQNDTLALSSSQLVHSLSHKKLVRGENKEFSSTHQIYVVHCILYCNLENSIIKIQWLAPTTKIFQYKNYILYYMYVRII